jgi:hypothetical protein
MAVTSRSILGDIVTAYEITPSGNDLGPEPAERDDETVTVIFERLMQESQRLTNTIKSERQANSNSVEKRS